MVFSSIVFIFKFLPLFFMLYGVCPSRWKNVCLFIGKIKDCLLIDTSANLLAEVVVEAIRNDQAPKAILTFNGEAVFLALLNYYYWIVSDSCSSN